VVCYCIASKTHYQLLRRNLIKIRVEERKQAKSYTFLRKLSSNVSERRRRTLLSVKWTNKCCNETTGLAVLRWYCDTRKIGMFRVMTSLPLYKIAWRHNPQDSNTHVRLTYILCLVRSRRFFGYFHWGFALCLCLLWRKQGQCLQTGWYFLLPKTIRGSTIKLTNSPPCACSGSTGQRP